MGDDDATLVDQEHLLDEVLGEYLEALDAGRAEEWPTLKERHPQIADRLAQFAQDDECLDRWLRPLRPPPASLTRDSVNLGLTRLDPTRWPPPAQRLTAGSFGDYELLEEIGQGGMGMVFRARQKSLNRIVALKMIRAGRLATPAEVQRFKNEAEAAASLDHPRIVPIYEIGEFESQSYFTMKLFEGGNLVAQLPRFAADPQAAARLVMSLAQAVHHAHQRGILHRDLKPSNILLDAEGRPHISDFGLAKWLQTDSGLTQPGAIVGTPSYMAPEQATPALEPSAETREDRRPRATTAADIYGLGAILYALLAGRPPFQGESMLETLEQVRRKEPAPLSVIGRRIDRDLETICLKCLEKEPRARYGSAEALAEDLERWLTGEAILARPRSRPQRIWRWCRRNPVLAGGSVIIAAQLVALAGVLAAGWNLLETERVNTGEQRHLADLQRIRLEQQQSQLRQLFYEAEVKLAAQAWQQGDVPSAMALLARYRPGSDGADRSGFEWRYLNRLCQTSSAATRVLRGHRKDVYHVAFASDGSLLASSGADGTLRFWDLRGNRPPRTIAGPTTEINWIAFSPNGQLVATAGDDGAICLWRVADGQRLQQLRGHRGEAVAVVFSADGKQLFSGGEDASVRIWDGATGQPRGELRGHQGRIEAMALAPDGRHLATASQDRSAILWDLDHQRPGPRLRTGDSPMNCIEFAPDGQTLATGGQDGVIRLWRATGAFLRVLGSHPAAVQSVAFAPDGETLASCSNDNTIRVWDLRTGNIRNQFAGHDDRIWCVAYAPNGKTLATASRDGTIKLWDPTARRDYQRLAEPGGPVRALVFGADGEMLASATDSGSLHSWPLSSAPAAAAFDGRLQIPPVIAFDPASGSWAYAAPTGRVRISAPESRQARELSGPTPDPITSLAFLPNTSQLLIGTQGGSWGRWAVHETTPPTWERVFPNSQALLTASRDGQLVAVAGGGTVRLWDVRSRAWLSDGSLSGAEVTCLAFSPQTPLLAVGGSDATITLVDPATGKARLTLLGNRLAVTSLAFSVDGKTLASGGLDGTVRLWSVATGHELYHLEVRPGGTIYAIAFSPDGEILAAGGKSADDQGEIWLWFAGPESGPLPARPIDP